MAIQFVTVEVALQPSPGKTRDGVLRSLHSLGEPLRWAITSVDGDRRLALVEAVVLQEAPLPIQGGESC